MDVFESEKRKEKRLNTIEITKRLHIKLNRKIKIISSDSISICFYLK